MNEHRRICAVMSVVGQTGVGPSLCFRVCIRGHLIYPLRNERRLSQANGLRSASPLCLLGFSTG